MERTLGIGVVSLGWMGRVHTRAYRDLREHFPHLPARLKLVSCCDPQLATNPELAEILGFERIADSYQELIDDPEVDVISICSPNYLHHPIALAVAKAGKPFWIEKPMGISAAQSREIAQAACERNLVTSVGFNYRHAPAIAYARQLIDEGALGRITNARVWLIADYASDPAGPLTWRYDPQRAGAGVILDLLGHGADLIQYLLQDRLERVCATTDTFITERPIPVKAGIGHSGWEISDETGAVENEDYVAVLARTSAGVSVTMESSRVSVGPRAEYVVEVYGTQGSVRWNFENLNHLQVCVGVNRGAQQGYVNAMAGEDFPNFSRFQPGAGTSMGFDDLKVIEAALFIRGILTDQQLGPGAGDAWNTAEVDEAIIASARKHCWQEVAAVTAPTTFNRPPER